MEVMKKIMGRFDCMKLTFELEFNYFSYNFKLILFIVF